MAKILYGISGEGNGHVTRAKAVIDELKKDHDIIVVTSKNAYNYISKKHKKTIKITDLYLKYKNNRVSSWGTFFLNLNNLDKVINSCKKVKKIVDKEKPDVIINDFSCITNLVGLFMKRPIISLDNNQLVLKTKIDLPRRWALAALKAKIAIRCMVFTTDWRFITTFFFPPLKSKRANLIPPILRKEIINLKPKKGDYVLVYQTSDSNKELLKILQNINQKFIVYGFNKDEKIKNLHLKKFSDRGFIKDLQSAKAVIMNGGFTLMSECLYLKKPILSIPIEDQIEQMINARHLHKLGWGKYIEENDEQEIKLFLKNIRYYEKNLKKVNFDYKGYVGKLNKKINDFIPRS